MVDRAELEHLLEQVNAEKAVVQSRLATLTRAADGLQALLDMTPAPSEWIYKSDSDAGRATETASVSEPGQAAPGPVEIIEGAPRGLEAAQRILESDTSRYWEVREVSDEQIRRRWAKPRPRGTRGNPPARVALDRLHKKYPNNVQVRTTPVLAYKWIPEPAPSVNGSANDFTPAVPATGVSTTGENGTSIQAMTFSPERS